VLGRFVGSLEVADDPPIHQIRASALVLTMVSNYVKSPLVRLNQTESNGNGIKEKRDQTFACKYND
jgi:hypothetical protein